MMQDKTKQIFTEPEYKVVRFSVEDIVTTSDEDDWYLGEEEI